MNMTFTLSDFDYDLPADLIAQAPLAERSASRLLAVGELRLEDLHFRDLPALLAPGDLLVFNDTRVVKARLYGEKSTGGQVEMLIERVLGEHEAISQMRVSKKPAVGALIRVAGRFDVEVVARNGEFWTLRFPPERSVFDWLEDFGALPLPPYIERAANLDDEERYQTVFATARGSVAAPTAGLHFDDALLARVAELGVETSRVTLHVGAGTFSPVRVDNIAEHRMHSERIQVGAATVEAIERTRARGGRVICVGTTSLRALESAARGGTLAPVDTETDIFITPGFRFRVADALITNFHLPKSTLMMLVCAFGGMDRVKRAYAHAVSSRYRFFSYGDAMFLPRATAQDPT